MGITLVYKKKNLGFYTGSWGFKTDHLLGYKRQISSFFMFGSLGSKSQKLHCWVWAYIDQTHLMEYSVGAYLSKKAIGLLEGTPFHEELKDNIILYCVSLV